MPGSGPAPKENRRRANAPQRGEWQNAPAVGWQHGRKPMPPRGLSRTAKEAWKAWFGSWVASFWRPEDVYGLRVMILLYDEVLEKPTPSKAQALGQYLDRFGLTPKGLQDRRWRAPEPDAKPQAEKPKRAYAHLRAIGE